MDHECDKTRPLTLQERLASQALQTSDVPQAFRRPKQSCRCPGIVLPERFVLLRDWAPVKHRLHSPWVISIGSLCICKRRYFRKAEQGVCRGSVEGYRATAASQSHVSRGRLVSTLLDHTRPFHAPWRGTSSWWDCCKKAAGSIDMPHEHSFTTCKD